MVPCIDKGWLNAHPSGSIRGTVMIALLVLASSSMAQQHIKPDDMQFTFEQANRPLIAKLMGNRQKAELYAFRVKFPKDFLNAPHSHRDSRMVTVISGTLYFAYGDSISKSDLRAYPAGTFLTEEAGRAHYAWAKDGEVVLQISGFGPTSTTDVEPK